MSSGSESDEEFVPGEPEQLSEEDSADDETDKQYETELKHKANKRKSSIENTSKKKRSKKEQVEEPEDIKVEEPELSSNPEEEKKREEDLWAKFLEGTDTKPKAAGKDTTVVKPAAILKVNKDTPIKTGVNSTEDEKIREKKIFEFAGETIVVENNVIKERLPTKSSESSPAGSKSQAVPPRGRSSGGLASFIGQLNKKNTLSTLEKTKLDWNTYKKDEGVEEEIQTHNKGKGGYLDRQDFLERADIRQYEIERDLRMTRRSNR